MSEATPEQKQEEYGYDYLPGLMIMTLFAVIIIGMLNYNSGLTQQKTLDEIKQNQTLQASQIDEIHSALWQQIHDAKERDEISTIPFVDAPKQTNESIAYSKNKILLVTSPTCTICEEQEAILKKLGLEYSKVCMRISAMDAADCERQGYMPWDKSQYIISAYQITAVPVIILNTSKTRTGMIYWDLAKEENDLRSALT
jgi:glutaredoxin